MPSERPDTANAFAETACKLLIEYADRLVVQKQEAVKILDQFHASRASKMDSGYLSQRYKNEMHEFIRSREVFETLIRKASQWVEHGRSPQPHLELELEVRLADLENMLRSMDYFFQTNHI
jgi:uroporphyrinogen-III decarboxylase